LLRFSTASSGDQIDMELPEYTIHVVEPNDVAEIQSLFESDPDYFEIAEGAPPGSSAAEDLITALPEGKDYSDKFVYTVFDGHGDLAAAIDLIRGYPENGIWFLGLLFVAPWTRNIGLGTRIIEAICAHVKQQGGHAIRLSVVRGNFRARALYERKEFHFIYEGERTHTNAFAVMVDVFERKL
jgi:RimJ/RimL family protein N-acetyltransferase